MLLSLLQRVGGLLQRLLRLLCIALAQLLRSLAHLLGQLRVAVLHTARQLIELIGGALLLFRSQRLAGLAICAEIAQFLCCALKNPDWQAHC